MRSIIFVLKKIWLDHKIHRLCERTKWPKDVNNHRSVNSAVVAVENDFLEHNGERAPELQFVCGTCDVTDCIHAEGILDSF